MLAVLILEEIEKTIKVINNGKAPGLDGIPIEALLPHDILPFIINIWQGSSVHKDELDSTLYSLYKSKESKSVCSNYRGVSLLEAIRKPFANILHNRLVKWFCPLIISVSQSGFRSGRRTVCMTFSRRQLQEECIKHGVPLY